MELECIRDAWFERARPVTPGTEGATGRIPIVVAPLDRSLLVKTITRRPVKAYTDRVMCWGRAECVDA